MTAPGGSRSGRESRAGEVEHEVQFSRPVSKATMALLTKALERFDGTPNDFLAEAARRSLADRTNKKPW